MSIASLSGQGTRTLPKPLTTLSDFTSSNDTSTHSTSHQHIESNRAPAPAPVPALTGQHSTASLNPSASHRLTGSPLSLSFTSARFPLQKQIQVNQSWWDRRHVTLFTSDRRLAGIDRPYTQLPNTDFTKTTPALLSILLASSPPQSR